MYHTILVPLDGSAFSERALPVATAVAHATDSQLVLMRAASAAVLPGAHSPDLQGRQIIKEDLFISADAGGAGRPAAQLKAIEKAEQYLTDIAAPLVEQGFRVSVAVPYSAAAEGILTEIEVQAADMVVMCTHGRSGLGRWIYGSVAEEVLAHSPAPVLLVRPTGTPALLTPTPGGVRLLVPLDGSAFAEAALPHAAALARALGGSIQLLHVIISPTLSHTGVLAAQTGMVDSSDQVAEDEERAKRYLAALSQSLAQEKVTVQTSICEGSPADMIVQQGLALDTRLIVMATHGRSGLRRLLLGSVAREVVHRTLLPVLLVRPSQPPRA